MQHISLNPTVSGYLGFNLLNLSSYSVDLMYKSKKIGQIK